MPWWSWVLIWTGLVLVLLGMLAWFAVTLFRKLMALADAVGALGDLVGGLDADPAEETPPRRPAIFADWSELALAVDLQRTARERHRQERRDRRIARGKLLQHGPIVRPDPPMKRTQPHA
ncbi:hypothetical protein KIV56_02080 [Cryobacterium breve]|uniref:Uncharacterized protein n=1 Tax=Cryobacterium breve TaxID=1259258 RepID=A0ABY7NCU8_9MICO|nr:hypothetical protein [Cryobacterium breve]WBM80342.1 hypothetical protein KIV56_02080 [Cryobacterium breve]